MLWSGRRPGPWTWYSLSRHGYHVIAAHPDGADDGWTPPGGTLRGYPDAVRRPGTFLDWLTRTCAHDGVDAVIPLDETLVGLLANAGDRFGAAVIGPDAGRYRALCDKAVLPVTCAEAGIGHPRTWLARSADDVAFIPGASWVVKPGRADAGGPAVEVVTRREVLAARVRGITARGSVAVVQEHLRGIQWGVWCVVTATGVTGLAARVRETAPRTAGTPSRFMVDGTGRHLVRDAGQLLGHAGFRGMANLDVIEADGRAHILDVNLRPAASAGLPVRAGIDLAAMAVADRLGMPTPAPRAFRPFAYTSVQGELAVLTSGRADGRGFATALRLAADILRPGVMADPSPLGDPGWYRSLLPLPR